MYLINTTDVAKILQFVEEIQQVSCKAQGYRLEALLYF